MPAPSSRLGGQAPRPESLTNLGHPVLIAELALPVPLAHTFSYVVPPHLVARVQKGVRCVCPFRSKKLVGVVVALREEEVPDPKLKSIAQVLGEPSLPEDLVDFLRDIAGYYLAPIGEVVRLALPPMDRVTEQALQEPSLFPDATRGVAPRKVQWVLPTDGAPPADLKLSAQQAGVLAHVRSVGASQVARLEQTWKSARAATAKLVELGLLRFEERERPDDPFFREGAEKEAVPTLTAAQDAAAQAIRGAIADGKGHTFLLRGVTGSGKTEVYFRAIEDTKASGRSTIVLVPEIALTPQLVARFRGRFGDDVAVLHSGLTPKERLGMWSRLRSGQVDVVIGARSALFAPVAKLGLLVVDEEHDPSFKQEEGVRYQARDMAILRAHRGNAVAILGSATPSLETEYLVIEGKARVLELPTRARAQELPEVRVIDLRKTGPGPTGDKRISLPLHRALEDALARGEQSILFLNRRGFSPSARCEACGKHAECPNCSVALTYHKRRGSTLRCHYCDYEIPMLANCTHCGSGEIALEGIGTERLEETLSAAFPTARVARLDRDVASGKEVEKILTRVRNREVDILVGTQMVTKGHDLPAVTLVGVINADAALSIPDFRAAERAFHLMVQVAGRAGRGDAKGRVLIQTYDPDHPAIKAAVRHDVRAFTEREMEARKELLYPPYARLVLVRVDGPDEAETLGAARLLAEVARRVAGNAVEVVGPAPAPLTRLKARFRFRLMLRGQSRKHLRDVARAVYAAMADLPRKVHATVDIDPVQFL